SASVQSADVLGCVRHPEARSSDLSPYPGAARRCARTGRARRRRPDSRCGGRAGRRDERDPGHRHRAGDGAREAARGDPRPRCREGRGRKAGGDESGMRRRSSVDRRIYAIAAGVIVVVLSLYLAAPGFLKTVENKLFDLHFTLRGVRHPAAPVAIVAQIVRNLTAAGASVIAVDILVSEPEVTGESRAMSRLAERFDALGVTAATPEGKALRAETDELARRDPDRQLAAAIGDTGRTVLPIVFDLRAGIPDAAPEPSGTPLKSALTRFRGYAERGLYPPPHADRATAPIASFAGSAQALGHVTMIPDRDGTTRWEALVFEYNDSYYPSLGVQAVRLF